MKDNFSGELKSKKPEIVAFFLIGLTFALMAGRFRNSISGAESVHFSINFPAQNAITAGGIGPQGHEGEVIVNLSKTGFLKRLIQPNIINLSSHWITNRSDKPLKIAIRLLGCNYPVVCSTPEKSWNEQTKSFDRKIKPGEMISMDWDIKIPDKMMEKKIILNGGVEIIDVKNNRRLSYLPLKIIDTDNEGLAKNAECCSP